MHKGSAVDNIHKGIYFSYNRKNDFFHFPSLPIYTIFVFEFQIKRIMATKFRPESRMKRDNHRPADATE